MNLHLYVSGFFPLQNARGYTVKCWLSPSVYHTLEWSQCVFHSTALDTVISMQVVVGSQLLNYERKWGSVQGRQHRQESGVTWFSWRDTPGGIYWSWEPEVWVSSNAHAQGTLQDDPFLVFKSMKSFGFALSLWLLTCFCVFMHATPIFTLCLLFCIFLCYNLKCFPVWLCCMEDLDLRWDTGNGFCILIVTFVIVMQWLHKLSLACTCMFLHQLLSHLWSLFSLLPNLLLPVCPYLIKHLFN